jgi:hypothetical protein
MVNHFIKQDSIIKRGLEVDGEKAFNKARW